MEKSAQPCGNGVGSQHVAKGAGMGWERGQEYITHLSHTAEDIIFSIVTLVLFNMIGDLFN